MVANPALSAGGQQAPSHLGHASALQCSCSGGMLHDSSMLHLIQHVVDTTWLLQALPIFLDRLVDPVTAVVLSVTVVLFFGESSTKHVTEPASLTQASGCFSLASSIKAVISFFS